MRALSFGIVIGVMFSAWFAAVWMIQSVMRSHGRPHWMIRGLGWIGLIGVGCGFIAPEIDNRPFGLVIRLFDWLWGGAYHTAMLAIILGGVLLWISSAALLWSASRSVSDDGDSPPKRLFSSRRYGQLTLVTSVVTIALFLTQWVLVTQQLRVAEEQILATVARDERGAKRTGESDQSLFMDALTWAWPVWNIYDLDAAVTETPIPPDVEEFLRAHAHEIQKLEATIDQGLKSATNNEGAGSQLSVMVRGLVWRARWHAAHGRSEEAWSNWHRLGKLSESFDDADGLGMILSAMACRREQIRTLEWLIAAGIEVPQEVEQSLLSSPIDSSRLKSSVDQTMSEMLVTGCQAWLGKPVEDEPPWGGFRRGWPPRYALPVLVGDDLRGWQRWQEKVSVLAHQQLNVDTAVAVDALHERLIRDRIGFPWGREYSGHLVLEPGYYVVEFLNHCLEIQASWDIAKVGVAIASHRRTTEPFFSKPRELQAESVNELGIDLFTGEPLKFVKPDDKTVLIYSVGRNRRDDGGDFQESPGDFATDIVFRVRTQ